jgi:hypothetical protein
MTTALVKLFPAEKTSRNRCKFDALNFNAKPLAGTNQPVADARYYIDSVDDEKAVDHRGGHFDYLVKREDFEKNIICNFYVKKNIET